MTFKTTTAKAYTHFNRIKGKLYLLAPQMVFAAAVLCACFTTNAHASSQVDIVGPTGSGAFGTSVTTLPNGNIVVTDPLYDALGPIADVGAVYLYNGTTGALISTVTGSTANDQISSGGVTVLTNGNYVVSSLLWDGAVADVGAVTWCNATTGCSGVVSSANSLVGSSLNDQVGGEGVTPLTGGNYVVSSRFWDGTAVNVGAVTWGNGTTGTSGVVSSANSLVGSTANDTVGRNGITPLTNGNYVVGSQFWRVNIGAVTWGNGMTGISGVVSSANSLVGSTAFDQIGNRVSALTNGNYVVSIASWTGTASSVGAVTWCNGTTGRVGPVSAANSLVGSTANDQVGSNTTALTNGNYVVSSPNWNGTAAAVGAVTWCNGTTGTIGIVSAANSLVGSTASNQVGISGVKALTNGNYVVSSSSWDGTAANVGAVTWGNGTTGTTGVVSSANSLVGSTLNDQVSFGGLTALSNGNYVVSSRFWDGTAADVGAVTWGSGTSGTSGVVSSANSLVGSTANDTVGSLFISSGSFGTDLIFNRVTALTNGNYVVSSPLWDGTAVNVGAATWGNGTTGVSGVVSSANSLVGSTMNDQVSFGGLTALSNGNYVVNNQNWNGTAAGVGAVTWGNGTTGISGAVSSANSLVGSTAGDGVGYFTRIFVNASTPPTTIFDGVMALSNGNYVVSSRRWDNGATVDAGAISYGIGVGGTPGLITAANSVLGTVANGGVTAAGRATMDFSFNTFNQTLVVGRPASNIVTIFTPDGTTAAGVSISGRVKTTEGRGVRNARVVLTDQNGQRRSVITSARGYYRFDDVEAGQNVILSVQSRRFQFDPRVIDVSDNLTDIDFFPNP